MLKHFAFLLYFCVSLCKSDDTTERIIGGSRAAPNEFPYYVGLGIILRNTTTNKLIIKSCAGALVKPNRVITAKHCMQSTKEKPIVEVQVYPNYDNTNKIGKQGAKYIVASSIRVHPGDKDQFDLAILHLPSSIKLPTVNLPTRDFPPGTEVTFCGLGADNHVKATDFLMKIKLRITDEKDCKTQSDLKNFKCFKILGQQQACTGDSGGPAVVKGPTPASDILVGVVSAGIDLVTTTGPVCKKTYNIITNIYAFRNWINQNL